MRPSWKRSAVLALPLAMSCGSRPVATTEAQYVRAAEHGNLPILGLEVAAVGLGFLVGQDPGGPTIPSLGALETVFNGLFSACATITTRAETGELQVVFAAAGCGIPQTSIKLQGALTFRSIVIPSRAL